MSFAFFRSHSRKSGALGFLSVALLLIVVLCAGVGAVEISPAQVFAILAGKLGISAGIEFAPHQEAILWTIRLPRVLLAVLVGAGLAVSGAAMQGLFRNPLADPGLVGVSSGAALAAVSFIVLGDVLFGPVMARFGVYALPVVSFAGGLGSVLLVYWLAMDGKRISVATMLLAGIAIGAMSGAGIGLFTFLATDAQLRSFTFWSLGSLGGASWKTLAVIAPVLLISLFLFFRVSRALNALVLGEAEAGHLGAPVERVKFAIVALCALVVGVSVSASGMIGFVGLVIPHLVRMTLGPDHRWLLPGSALLGAALLLGADVIARTVMVPAELPIGIVTATLGAPFFLYLLIRNKRQRQWM